MTFTMVNNTRQPPPYNTNCRNYRKHNMTSQNDCLKRCLTAECVQRFDKYPFSTIVEEKVELGHLTDTDLRNETVAKELTEIEKLCGSQCTRKD